MLTQSSEYGSLVRIALQGLTQKYPGAFKKEWGTPSQGSPGFPAGGAFCPRGLPGPARFLRRGPGCGGWF